MSSSTPTVPIVATDETLKVRRPVGARIHGWLTAVPTGVLWLLVILWTVPSLGLFISSFRNPDDVRVTGWWNFFTDPSLSLESYKTVFSDSSDGVNLGTNFLNTLAITIPGTLLPLAFAAFAAYAFAWMNFKGRDWMFIGVVAMMAVPLQVALIPLLQLFNGGAHLSWFGPTITLIPDFDLNGTPAAAWLAHVGFGLPVAIFLLHNYMAGLPKDIFEAARIDGADHPTIFWRLVMPLSVPALAAFAIFQFLWVWNDYLVALTFVGGNPENAPMTLRLAVLSGGRGQNWPILTAAAFVSTVLPLAVFFALQRYFVRGLLAGSVKG